MSIPGLQPPPPFLPSPGHPAAPLGPVEAGLSDVHGGFRSIRSSSGTRKSDPAHLSWHGGAADFLYTEASRLAVWLCYRYCCQPFEYK
ncbi:hypothetical protein MTO96_031249 [Rhipicephalus appendiculatus]